MITYHSSILNSLIGIKKVMQSCLDNIRSCGLSLGQSYNSIKSCCEGLPQITSSIASRVFFATTSVWNKVHSLADRMTITESAFERGIGFWSKPADERNQSFFGALTNINSQRENWYSVSPYVGEFLCTVSNVGFIYVGLKHKSPELLFAGVASALSHSIPKQWLLTIDKIGVLIVLSKLMREYQTVRNYPWLLAPVAVAGAVNLADSYLSRQYGLTWPHIVWHLSSAFLANVFLSYANQ